MAGTVGTADHPLIDALLKEGHRFDFFQAISLIEKAHPECVPVGEIGPASREILRMRPEVLLGFPPGAVASIEKMDAAGAADGGFTMTRDLEERFRITATFLGLYGADSPLPNHWAEEILFEHREDPTVRDFLDIFHHRIYSLFYRTWTKYRFHVQYRTDGRDRFSPRLLALIGLLPAEVRRATGIPAERLLRYAGLLVQRPRSAAGLEAFISDWFEGLPARVTPCEGRWVTMDPGDRTRLGQGPATLGENAILGQKIHDVSGKFRLTLGPIDYAAYRRFLPDGEDHGLLRSLVRFFVTDHLDTDVELRLMGPEVPPLELNPEDPPRLGWTTWLVTRPSPDVSNVFSMRNN